MQVKVTSYGDSTFGRATVSAEITIRYDEKTEFMGEMKELLDRYSC